MEEEVQITEEERMTEEVRVAEEVSEEVRPLVSRELALSLRSKIMSLTVDWEHGESHSGVSRVS